jgi:hypothetical protein
MWIGMYITSFWSLSGHKFTANKLIYKYRPIRGIWERIWAGLVPGFSSLYTFSMTTPHCKLYPIPSVRSFVFPGLVCAPWSPPPPQLGPLVPLLTPCAPSCPLPVRRGCRGFICGPGHCPPSSAAQHWGHLKQRTKLSVTVEKSIVFV